MSPINRNTSFKYTSPPAQSIKVFFFNASYRAFATHYQISFNLIEAASSQFWLLSPPPGELMTNRLFYFHQLFVAVAPAAAFFARLPKKASSAVAARASNGFIQ